MNARKTPVLSKSRFLAGLQCNLRLWNHCYNPHLASEVSPARQAMFDTGHRVGKLATCLFPKGILVEEDHHHHDKAVKTSQEAMNDSDVPAIFEAAFLYEGVRIRVDILKRLDDGRWHLIEVKSSTSVKEVYLPDVAIQFFVLQGSGLKTARASIMYLNRGYVYDGGKLELENLFSSTDLTEQVISSQQEISTKIEDLKAMLSRTDPPVIIPSRFCSSPYACEFWEHCTREMPEFWVLNLSGMDQSKINELASLNIQDIRDIPDSFPLSPLQERIKRCVIKQEEYLSPALEFELRDVTYPIHFLDFETVAPAIPRYPGTRPYHPLPFQWSDHILYEGGILEHREYLCDEDKDPRKEFARTLLESLGRRGTIFVYTLYERNVIDELSGQLPQFHNQLLSTVDRFKDLHALIRRYYYHPSFHGSFSLKSVLPALVPEMGYQDLAIQEGSHASLEYLRMIDSSTSEGEREGIKKALRSYCAQDTLAMVKIREKLIRQ